jgi:hypothetical protein
MDRTRCGGSFRNQAIRIVAVRPVAWLRIYNDRMTGRRFKSDTSWMDETRRRRLSIARELVTWGVAMPVLLARLAEASKRATLPARLQIEFEAMARRITTQFNAIGEAPEADSADETAYDQLIENTDRLRELMGVANAALDLLLKAYK